MNCLVDLSSVTVWLSHWCH